MERHAGTSAGGEAGPRAVAGGAAVPGLVGAWRDVPRLAAEPPGITAYMRLRAGTAAGGRAAAPRWAGIAGISPFALCAIVGAEDPAFFQHHGIWWGRVAGRTASGLLGGRPIAGVSTITQQLARNLYLHERRRVGRKLREMLLARRLEAVLDKARILELYVNVAEWGPGIWGIEDAAGAWFGSTAATLNPFQAVVLASLLPAPHAPLAGRNLARALGSQTRLLHFLYGSGVMTLSGWRQTGERLSLLSEALRAGRAASEVLPELGDLTYLPAAVDAGTPTAAELLASRCGLRLRVAYTRLLHAEGHPRGWMARLPYRWAGRLAG